MKTKKDRISYYDALRVFEIIAVIMSSRPLFWFLNHTSTDYWSNGIPRYRKDWCAYFSNDQRSASFKQVVSQSVRLFKKKICKNSLSVHLLDYSNPGPVILSRLQCQIHLGCFHWGTINYMIFLDFNRNLSVHTCNQLICKGIWP